jgi:hypothetical protein
MELVGLVIAALVILLVIRAMAGGPIGEWKKHEQDED